MAGNAVNSGEYPPPPPYDTGHGGQGDGSQQQGPSPEVFGCSVPKCVRDGESVFPTFGELCDHWKVAHDPATQFYCCSICGLLAHSYMRDAYVTHLQEVHGLPYNGSLELSEINTSFIHPQGHFPPPGYKDWAVCSLWRNFYARNQQPKQLIWKGEGMACPVRGCPKGKKFYFGTIHDLKNHWFDIHEPKCRAFVCNLCPANLRFCSKSSRTVQGHMINVHRDVLRQGSVEHPMGESVTINWACKDPSPYYYESIPPELLIRQSSQQSYSDKGTAQTHVPDHLQGTGNSDPVLDQQPLSTALMQMLDKPKGVGHPLPTSCQDYQMPGPAYSTVTTQWLSDAQLSESQKAPHAVTVMKNMIARRQSESQEFLPCRFQQSEANQSSNAGHSSLSQCDLVNTQLQSGALSQSQSALPPSTWSHTQLQSIAGPQMQLVAPHLQSVSSQQWQPGTQPQLQSTMAQDQRPLIPLPVPTMQTKIPDNRPIDWVLDPDTGLFIPKSPSASTTVASNTNVIQTASVRPENTQESEQDTIIESSSNVLPSAMTISPPSTPAKDHQGDLTESQGFHPLLNSPDDASSTGSIVPMDMVNTFPSITNVIKNVVENLISSTISSKPGDSSTSGNESSLKGSNEVSKRPDNVKKLPRKSSLVTETIVIDDETSDDEPTKHSNSNEETPVSVTETLDKSVGQLSDLAQFLQIDSDAADNGSSTTDAASTKSLTVDKGHLVSQSNQSAGSLNRSDMQLGSDLGDTSVSIAPVAQSMVPTCEVDAVFTSDNNLQTTLPASAQPPVSIVPPSFNNNQQNVPITQREENDPNGQVYLPNLNLAMTSEFVPQSESPVTSETPLEFPIQVPSHFAIQRLVQSVMSDLNTEKKGANSTAPSTAPSTSQRPPVTSVVPVQPRSVTNASPVATSSADDSKVQFTLYDVQTGSHIEWVPGICPVLSCTKCLTNPWELATHWQNIHLFSWLYYLCPACSGTSQFKTTNFAVYCEHLLTDHIVFTPGVPESKAWSDLWDATIIDEVPNPDSSYQNPGNLRLVFYQNVAVSFRSFDVLREDYVRAKAMVHLEDHVIVNSMTKYPLEKKKICPVFACRTSRHSSFSDLVCHWKRLHVKQRTFYACPACSGAQYFSSVDPRFLWQHIMERHIKALWQKFRNVAHYSLFRAAWKKKETVPSSYYVNPGQFELQARPYSQRAIQMGITHLPTSFSTGTDNRPGNPTLQMPNLEVALGVGTDNQAGSMVPPPEPAFSHDAGDTGLQSMQPLYLQNLTGGRDRNPKKKQPCPVRNCSSDSGSNYVFTKHFEAYHMPYRLVYHCKFCGITNVVQDRLRKNHVGLHHPEVNFMGDVCYSKVVKNVAYREPTFENLTPKVIKLIKTSCEKESGRLLSGPESKLTRVELKHLIDSFLSNTFKEKEQQKTVQEPRIIGTMSYCDANPTVPPPQPFSLDKEQEEEERLLAEGLQTTIDDDDDENDNNFATPDNDDDDDVDDGICVDTGVDSGHSSSEEDLIITDYKAGRTRTKVSGGEQITITQVLRKDGQAITGHRSKGVKINTKYYENALALLDEVRQKEKTDSVKEKSKDNLKKTLNDAKQGHESDPVPDVALSRLDSSGSAASEEVNTVTSGNTRIDSPYSLKFPSIQLTKCDFPPPRNDSPKACNESVCRSREPTNAKSINITENTSKELRSTTRSEASESHAVGSDECLTNNLLAMDEAQRDAMSRTPVLKLVDIRNTPVKTNAASLPKLKLVKLSTKQDDSWVSSTKEKSVTPPLSKNNTTPLCTKTPPMRNVVVSVPKLKIVKLNAKGEDSWMSRTKSITPSPPKNVSHLSTAPTPVKNVVVSLPKLRIAKLGAKGDSSLISPTEEKSDSPSLPKKYSTPLSTTNTPIKELVLSIPNLNIGKLSAKGGHSPTTPVRDFVVSVPKLKIKRLGANDSWISRPKDKSVSPSPIKKNLTPLSTTATSVVSNAADVSLGNSPSVRIRLTRCDNLLDSQATLKLTPSSGPTNSKGRRKPCPASVSRTRRESGATSKNTNDLRDSSETSAQDKQISGNSTSRPKPSKKNLVTFVMLQFTAGSKCPIDNCLYHMNDKDEWYRHWQERHMWQSVYYACPICSWICSLKHGSKLAKRHITLHRETSNKRKEPLSIKVDRTLFIEPIITPNKGQGQENDWAATEKGLNDDGDKAQAKIKSKNSTAQKDTKKGGISQESTNEKDKAQDARQNPSDDEESDVVLLDDDSDDAVDDAALGSDSNEGMDDVDDCPISDDGAAADGSDDNDIMVAADDGDDEPMAADSDSEDASLRHSQDTAGKRKSTTGKRKMGPKSKTMNRKESMRKSESEDSVEDKPVSKKKSTSGKKKMGPKSKVNKNGSSRKSELEDEDENELLSKKKSTMVKKKMGPKSKMMNRIGISSKSDSDDEDDGVGDPAENEPPPKKKLTGGKKKMGPKSKMMNRNDKEAAKMAKDKDGDKLRIKYKHVRWEKGMRCPIGGCVWRFVHPNDFRRHWNLYHIAKVPAIQCPYCEENYSPDEAYYDFKNHLKNKHRQKLLDKSDDDIKAAVDDCERIIVDNDKYVEPFVEKDYETAVDLDSDEDPEEEVMDIKDEDEDADVKVKPQYNRGKKRKAANGRKGTVAKRRRRKDESEDEDDVDESEAESFPENGVSDGSGSDLDETPKQPTKSGRRSGRAPKKVESKDDEDEEMEDEEPAPKRTPRTAQKKQKTPKESDEEDDEKDEASDKEDSDEDEAPPPAKTPRGRPSSAKKKNETPQKEAQGVVRKGLPKKIQKGKGRAQKVTKMPSVDSDDDDEVPAKKTEKKTPKPRSKVTKAPAVQRNVSDDDSDEKAKSDSDDDVVAPPKKLDKRRPKPRSKQTKVQRSASPDSDNDSDVSAVPVKKTEKKVTKAAAKRKGRKVSDAQLCKEFGLTGIGPMVHLCKLQQRDVKRIKDSISRGREIEVAEAIPTIPDRLMNIDPLKAIPTSRVGALAYKAWLEKMTSVLSQIDNIVSKWEDEHAPPARKQINVQFEKEESDAEEDTGLGNVYDSLLARIEPGADNDDDDDKVDGSKDRDDDSDESTKEKDKESLEDKEKDSSEEKEKDSSEEKEKDSSEEKEKDSSEEKDGDSSEEKDKDSSADKEEVPTESSEDKSSKKDKISENDAEDRSEKSDSDSEEKADGKEKSSSKSKSSDEKEVADIPDQKEMSSENKKKDSESSDDDNSGPEKMETEDSDSKIMEETKKTEAEESEKEQSSAEESAKDIFTS